MEKKIISYLINDMIQYEQGTPRRIGHFLKVHSLAATIGHLEAIDEQTLLTLEIAAVLHDIGIKPSIEKYQSTAGNYQEIEGPPAARKLLSRYHLSDEMCDRVCFLIANHHTYGQIRAIDYQILIEADFLVNMHEDQMSQKQITTIRDKYFKTKTGLSFVNQMFLSSENYD